MTTTSLTTFQSPTTRLVRGQALLALLVVAFSSASTTKVQAACGDASSPATECLSCLSLDGCDAWVPTVGECFVSCQDAPQDTGCYSTEFFVDESVEAICTIAEEDQADATLCSNAGADGCETCTAILLSDGERACQWFAGTGGPGGQEGFCASGCGMEGCGVTTCDGVDGDMDGDENDVDCESFESCAECLEESCAWIPGGFGCMESCDVVADVSCYNAETFPDFAEAETCQAADEIEAEAALCDRQDNCTACVDTALSTNSTCQWIAEYNFCSSACTQVGCGTTTCQDDSPDPSTCEENTTCEECLGNACAWVPMEGCLPSCSVIADTSCYELDVGVDFPTSTTRQGGETPESVCAVAAANESDAAACSNQTDCGSCVSTSLSNGMNTCSWYGTYCDSLACGMDSCGSTTCDDDDASTSLPPPTLAEDEIMGTSAGDEPTDAPSESASQEMAFVATSVLLVASAVTIML